MFLEQACKNRLKNITLQYYPSTVSTVSTVECSKGERICDGRKCIHATQLCDGEADCEDGSDEEENICRKSETL